MPATTALPGDAPSGSPWFWDVLGLRSGDGGPEYEVLLDGDELVAQLHP